MINKKIGNIVFNGFILLLICYLIWNFGIEEIIQDNKAQDKFCQDRGLNKAIDYESNLYSGRLSGKIKCLDGNWYYVSIDLPCIKGDDKLGRCIERGIIYYLY